MDELQHKFADSIGKMDLENLDVDFIEDMMLKSKPLQSVLNDIRNRQKVPLKFEGFFHVKSIHGLCSKALRSAVQGPNLNLECSDLNAELLVPRIYRR